MPLHKRIQHEGHTIIYVWHITESEEELLQGIELTPGSIERIASMNSGVHRKGYLSIRQLLRLAGYRDKDLFYTSDGKPHLKDGMRISITHSFEYSALGISRHPIGIDMEKNREKIKLIASKFVGDESNYIDRDKEVEFLTVLWGAKESLYKIHPGGGLLFRHHLPIEPFELKDRQTHGWIIKDDFYEKYRIFFEKINDYTLVFATT
jgi:phosphopantetheinyl transferase